MEWATEALLGTAVVVASGANGAPEAAWGDSFFFYGNDRRFPFATIVTQDYRDFDTASDLDRPGAFRVNLWVGRSALRRLLGSQQPDPVDYRAPDVLLPHPIYAAQGWVCIVNPGPATSDLLRSLLSEAHARAVARTTE